MARTVAVDRLALVAVTLLDDAHAPTDVLVRVRARVSTHAPTDVLPGAHRTADAHSMTHIIRLYTMPAGGGTAY